MKLIKSSKVVKFPRVSGTVSSALKFASFKSKENKWQSIIIIGEHSNGGTYITSRGGDHYGMIERAKFKMMMDDWRDGYL